MSNGILVVVITKKQPERDRECILGTLARFGRGNASGRW
jgi:hypothetical protein